MVPKVRHVKLKGEPWVKKSLLVSFIILKPQ